ncbi:MAG: hypothetical protein VX613_02245 [Candidatus Thermoplasmatota archaeon]|nr:hypothetical protein [Candidatus Thermoplasmatota archaeon]
MQNSISEIVEKKELIIQKRIENLSLFSGFILFLTALWCLWPIFSNKIDPLDVLTPAIIALVWAGLIPDFSVLNSTTRSRLGAATSVFWLPLAVIGAKSILDSDYKIIGGVLLIACSLSLLFISRNLLYGEFKVVRYRSIMGFVGVFAGLSVLIPQGFETNYLGLVIIFIGFIIPLKDWFGSDENRLIRKQFKQKLDLIENELLIHRSKGRAVDQAASLVLSASQEGHLDPEYGLEMISRARDSMTRAIRLEEDIVEIREDTEIIISKAEDIAPIAKTPRRTFIQAEREVQLGSLEEGEFLYRLSKKQATEICEWWEKAEFAISDAKRLLIEQKGQAIESLESLLTEAITSLETEKPKQAYEFAISIPIQLSSVEGNAEIGIQAIELAKQKLNESDGLNTELWIENLERAEKAIEIGDYSLGRGLAESILRQIDSERESMDFLRKALRKRSKIRLKWENFGNSSEWDKRLEEIEDAANELEWSHAVVLFERLNESLESEINAFAEANELLEFAKNEWAILKNKCDSIGIDLLDEQRRTAEQFISEAIKAIENGELEVCLDKLGESENMMEKLRRRV